mgnify:CR=1 FL=1
MIDQKKIAEVAGVSTATVSRAFTQAANVSPKTMAKIQQAMEKLGLQPIVALPKEAKRRTKHVLIICNDVANYFFSFVLKGICDQLVAMGLLPVVCNSGNNYLIEESHINYADTNDYLGIIFITATDTPALSALLQRISVPVILVNRYIHSIEKDTVSIDNYRGGYMAACHLIERGHRRIAYVATYKNTTPQDDRVRGFSVAIDEQRNARYPIHYKIFYGDSSVERGYLFGTELIKQGLPYTALFVADCQVAVGIVNALQHNGYNIPKDISILCFDDSVSISEYGLNLSTITYDPYSLGKTAASQLVNRWDSDNDDIIHIDLLPKLIERQSVANIK